MIDVNLSLFLLTLHNEIMQEQKLHKNSYYDLHENIALMRTQTLQLAQKYKHAYWAAGGQTVIARLLAFPRQFQK